MTGGPADRVRTVYLGSGAFGAPALRRLAGHPRIDLVAVVTAPARPVGRHAVLTPTPIAALAAELGVAPVLTPERLRAPESIAAVLALEPELAVLADYGQIVPPPLLELRFGALNLHPSALPRFRGASPVPATIAAGDEDAAISLMRMDAGLDTGPILDQVRVPLTGRETGPELEARLAELSADLLGSHLGPWLDGDIDATPQAEDGIVLTRPLRRADGRLDPERPAIELERLVRAYQPWPGTFAAFDGERLVVTQSRAEAGQPGDTLGALVRHGQEPALATIDGRLVLEQVTPPGKRSMPGSDWLRGRRPASG
ncbi:MAG: methionyl-tRNA formyltransferase [Chloroflexota bacterium]